MDGASFTDTESAASGSAGSSGLADNGLEYESYLNKTVTGTRCIPTFGFWSYNGYVGRGDIR